MASFLLGLCLVLVAPSAMAYFSPHAAVSPDSQHFPWVSSHDTFALQTQVSAVDSPQQSAKILFQQGLELYQAQRFTEALQQWNTAAHLFAKQSAILDQSLVLAYRSLGYQRLGQLSKAENELAQSRLLLDSLGNPQDDIGVSETSGKVLNIEGSLHWRRGQTEAALASWQQAGQFYQAANQAEGLAIAQINQAKALQILGFTREAESLLRQVYQNFLSQSSGPLRSAGLRNLGGVLRQLGDLDVSQQVLQESLAVAVDDHSRSLTLLELGNTEWAQGERLLAIGRINGAQSHLQAAKGYYQQVLNYNGDAVEAGLNLLGLAIETGQTDVTPLLLSLRAQVDELSRSRRRINATINLAERWLQFIDQGLHDQTADLSYLSLARLLSRATQDAQALNDRWAESYALGQLGHLYERIGSLEEAEAITQEAMLKLEGLNSPDLQYRWQWQLGRMAQTRGDRAQALVQYQSAISTLQLIRNNLLTINPEVQFSFRDNVEPVYREFVQLLLTADVSPDQQQLQQAIAAVDQLQLAELENYLGCEVATSSIQAIQQGTEAVIYPIVLDDRLAIISQLPGQTELSYHVTFVAEGQIEPVLQSLRTNLALPDRTPEVIEAATQLYDWLMRPIEAEVEQADAQTLVFVPDGVLRNVPMAVLFDGQQYLIEKGYAVAIAPRLELFLPSATTTQLRVKLGGVGVPQAIDDTIFPPIAKLEEELDRIAKVVDAVPPLLNEAFTVSNIQQQLQQDPVSAIHWKTHGIFSSDPGETYIVGYNQRITARTLNQLIGLGSQGGTQPLELLVLSACETAQGDNRAVLGLAGLAARTGTRSVLSALWIAFDTPNTEFMVRFYEALVQEGTTKAEAVRQAQLALINEYGYTTPYIWANYILIGNWA